MTVWQVACGEPQRDFSEVFFNHDVMLIGPGAPGPFEERRYKKAVKDEEVTKSHYIQISNFVNAPKAGDIVLLRLGHCVIGVGVIPESNSAGYGWSNAFSDVKEWDLQHYRRVIWGNPKLVKLIQGRKALFSNYKQQATFTRVHEDRILRKVALLEGKLPIRKLKPLPADEKELTNEEFGKELFQVGLSNESVEKAIEAIEKACRLQNWYWNDDVNPAEHEIIAHMTIPLMLALGWSEQLLAVEWGRIDLAFFDRAPRKPENCILICEAKRPHKPLESALEQAKEYVRTWKLTRCKKLLITSGTRLLIYRLKGKTWQQHGYVNLQRLKRNYVFASKASAADSLLGLIPSRISQ